MGTHLLAHRAMRLSVMQFGDVLAKPLSILWVVIHGVIWIVAESNEMYSLTLWSIYLI